MVNDFLTASYRTYARETNKRSRSPLLFRLDHVPVESRFLRQQFVALLTIAGYGDQEDVVPLRSSPNLMGEFVAGHFRHGDVRQDQLGLLLFDHRQGFRSTGCRAHVLLPRSAERSDDVGGRPQFVHNRDSMGWKGSHLVRDSENDNSKFIAIENRIAAEKTVGESRQPVRVEKTATRRPNQQKIDRQTKRKFE